MSSNCSSVDCLDDNCEGCKNGEKFCEDPRCYPDCPNCEGETSLKCINRRDAWDWSLISIIGILVLVVFILIVVMGWNWNSSKTTNGK